jgi:hypothetical protein
MLQTFKFYTNVRQISQNKGQKHFPYIMKTYFIYCENK